MTAASRVVDVFSQSSSSSLVIQVYSTITATEHKMSLHRKNTLVVDFSILPHRILKEKVEEFLKAVVKIDMADVRNIRLHNLDNCLYIEMRDAGVPPTSSKKASSTSFL